MEALVNAPGMTRIQDLPSELLYEIFRRVELEVEDDLGNLQQVCCRWYAIIDQWMGRIVTTSREMIVHPSNPNLSMVGLELISEIGVSYLQVNWRDGYLLEKPPSPLPSFKLPYLLKHLRLQGTIHPDLFKSLVKDTINLSILDLSLHILHHLRKSDLKELHFPRLKELKVTCHDHERESQSLSLPYLQTFLDENAFPRLTRLKVNFPVSGFETIKTLIGFLHRHHQMEELGIWMEFPRNFPPQDKEEINAIIGQIKSCRCRSLSMFQVDADLDYTAEIAGSHPYFEMMKELVMSQVTLYTLDLRMVHNLHHDNNNMLKTICTRVGSTLVKLRIYSFDGPDQEYRGQLDCRAFSPLKVLRNLDVKGLIFTITGSKFLPPTLKYLTFSAPMGSDEVGQILLEHPNLRFITLHYWGNRVHVELSLEILQQVVQNRRVKDLKLVHFPISDEFPTEGIPNGDPINPQRLTIGKSWSKIDWKLNNSGYYCNVQQD